MAISTLRIQSTSNEVIQEGESLRLSPLSRLLPSCLFVIKQSDLKKINASNRTQQGIRIALCAAGVSERTASEGWCEAALTVRSTRYRAAPAPSCPAGPSAPAFPSPPTSTTPATPTQTAGAARAKHTGGPMWVGPNWLCVVWSKEFVKSGSRMTGIICDYLGKSDFHGI